MKQTAMQIMLDDLKAKSSVYENAGMKESVSSIESSILLAEELLKIEKEQIIDALLFGDVLSPNTAEIYYNETYGGDK
jgi:hypothetical protein